MERNCVASILITFTPLTPHHLTPHHYGKQGSEDRERWVVGKWGGWGVGPGNGSDGLAMAHEVAEEGAAARVPHLDREVVAA